MDWLKDLNPQATEEDTLVREPVLGERYHLSWAKNRGMVWTLYSINGSKARMRTPRTGKFLETELSTLRHVNRNILENVKKRLKNEKFHS